MTVEVEKLTSLGEIVVTENTKLVAEIVKYNAGEPRLSFISTGDNNV